MCLRILSVPQIGKSCFFNNIGSIVSKSLKNTAPGWRDPSVDKVLSMQNLHRIPRILGKTETKQSEMHDSHACNARAAEVETGRALDLWLASVAKSESCRA